jgi:hypothetical protein
MAFDADDYEMFVMLSGGCSLDSSSKKNWVEESGGLPNYICRIARAIMRKGKSKSQAIAIAVNRVKKWAAGADDVDADTRAKAAKAVAEWTALKAKNKAKNVVKATAMTRDQEVEYLMLTYIPSYNTEIVRNAWYAKNGYDKFGAVEVSDTPREYSYIKELWTDHIIVECESKDGKSPKLKKIPFTIHPITHEVTFEEPINLEVVYVEVDDELTEFERKLLSEYL